MTSSNNAQQTLESKSDYKDDKAGHWEHWDAEFKAADSANKKWRKQGNKTVGKFLNDKKASETNAFRLNLFNSNINTIQDMMFGKLPEITISRKNMDFNDDAARVAGMILERMLNGDIGTPNDQYSEALRNNLEDRLLPGMGVSRVRYAFEEKKMPIAPVIDQQTGEELQAASEEMKITNERAPIDYVHWRDFKWSPARTWAEVRWDAFKTLMTKDQVVERWGEKIAEEFTYAANVLTADEDNVPDKEDPKQDAWQRAEVWEIWDKDAKKVVWWNKEYKKILDTKDDPLGLSGFFPNPEPMTANVSTTAFMPIPDYVIAEDLYNEVDQLETRIVMITDAIKVVGVYDSAEEAIPRLLKEGVENDLIPVNSYAAFAEKGGLKGTIEWMPIEEIANVLQKLVDRRNDATELLFQITGMSDIMRGASKQAGGPVSATERSLEAKFASVRIQALQDEFAKYATDLIRLRAEVVSLHFQPETIALQSNLQNGPDANLMGPAIELIKNDAQLIWRIEVKPESVAMVDYAQLKEERTAYMTALATFFQSASPMMEADPQSGPMLFELLKWGLAGFKGSSEIEGLVDQWIDQMKRNKEEALANPQPPPPSPEQIKADMETQKQQHEMQKMEMQQQFESEKLQAEMQAEQQTAQIAAQAIQQKAQLDMAEEQAQSTMRLAEVQANLSADLQREAAQAELNMQEKEQETAQIMERETHKANEAIRVADAAPTKPQG